MERGEAGGVEHPGEQRGDIAVTDKDFGMTAHQVEIEVLEQVIAAVAAARAENSAHLRTLEHCVQFAETAVGRSGEVEVALEDGIEVERRVAEAFEGAAPRFQILTADIACRRDNPDRIAARERRGLEQRRARVAGGHPRLS